MKKRSLKSLKLNKESISVLRNHESIKGGGTRHCDTDTTYNCGASWITRCDDSACKCL